jgi:hypothetical protein
MIIDRRKKVSVVAWGSFPMENSVGARRENGDRLAEGTKLPAVSGTRTATCNQKIRNAFEKERRKKRKEKKPRILLKYKEAVQIPGNILSQKRHLSRGSPGSLK